MDKVGVLLGQLSRLLRGNKKDKEVCIKVIIEGKEIDVDKPNSDRDWCSKCNLILPKQLRNLDPSQISCNGKGGHGLAFTIGELPNDENQ